LYKLFTMPKSELLTAIQLQNKKVKAEIKIMRILEKYNQICVDNHFQLENVIIKTSGTDADRRFDVDLAII